MGLTCLYEWATGGNRQAAIHSRDLKEGNQKVSSGRGKIEGDGTLKYAWHLTSHQLPRSECDTPGLSYESFATPDQDGDSTFGCNPR